MLVTKQLTTINSKVKPFLKWAGGKTQLLDRIIQYLPKQISHGEIDTYVEPFIGGGALFFKIRNLDNVKNFIISDINPELILAYRTIQMNVQKVISFLSDLKKDYYSISPQEQPEYYYQIREKFNNQLSSINFDLYQQSWIERTSWIIFLNRTCFNGLFRVNSKGKFNVPFGRYKNPEICDSENLNLVSDALQHVKILRGDFTCVRHYITNSTFVYFDPPYRPISNTASFTSYTADTFNDDSQLRLAKFYNELDNKKALLMLSNSDPQNINLQDKFFENAYKGYSIEKVKAFRMINSKSDGRGEISELLIMNYQYG
jgi:DNA adenine methylase